MMDMKKTVTAATTQDAIDTVLPEITRRLQGLAERRWELEARSRGAPDDKALAGELAALGEEQNRLKETVRSHFTPRLLFFSGALCSTV